MCIVLLLDLSTAASSAHSPDTGYVSLLCDIESSGNEISETRYLQYLQYLEYLEYLDTTTIRVNLFQDSEKSLSGRKNGRLKEQNDAKKLKG